MAKTLESISKGIANCNRLNMVHKLLIPIFRSIFSLKIKLILKEKFNWLGCGRVDKVALWLD